MRCRSLLGVLYFLSQSVELPAPDVQAGLVTVTEDDDGQPFDWSKVTGKVMTIHSQKDARRTRTSPSSTAAGGSTSPTTTRAQRPPSAC